MPALVANDVLPRARTAGAIVYLTQKLHSSYGRDSLASDRLDAAIEQQLLRLLPGWTYIGTRAAAPLHGAQHRADAFSGMCVTLSFAYVLLRVLNPDATPARVQRYLARGTPAELRSRLLRLNKFMVDVVSDHGRRTFR